MISNNQPEATICALSSGAGRAGVAVIRVSGPEAGAALENLAGDLPPPRVATLAELRNAARALIDKGLALWFPGPHSFTGEDVAEVQVHGGPAVIDALLEALLALPGLRAAEPGEFTRRAFEHGKLDLTAAEAVADLIQAETEGQRRQALRQMAGELGALYEGWRGALVNALARVEAEIDFAEEDQGDPTLAGAASGLKAEISGILANLKDHLDDGHRGERLRDGLYVAILGAPNVGKSSLLNALARRQAAIVSARAGTTRDVIEIHLDLGGYPVIVADTAGLKGDGAGAGTMDEIEAEGVRRALERAEAADLKLVVTDASEWPGLAQESKALLDSDALLVLNKMDLAGDLDVAALETLPAAALGPWGVSALSGDGLPALLEGLQAAVAGRLAGGGPALTRARHRRALEDCVAALERFLADGGQASAELAAEDLRLAVRALGRITGSVDVEDLLDIVFRDFCIGK